MRLDHLLSKETRDLKENPGVLRLASGARNGTLFNLEGTRLRRQDGGLAQLGERLLCKQEVNGSIPLISTIRARSSVGQSVRLIIVRSVVRAHSGPPKEDVV